MFHMEHLRQILWKCLTVVGSILWAIVVVSMFLGIAVAVFHGFNPSGFPDFRP